jgi:hypothetical protein
MNLNELARVLTLEEGGKRSATIAQTKELLGVLGRRWRRIGWIGALKDVVAIMTRAGR